MATRRVYASWLPPNPNERRGLLRLRRTQHLVIAWMVALIPAGWLVILLTPANRLFVLFTVVWIVIGLWFGRRVGATRCPRCGGRFSEKLEMPYWYGLFNSRCENCGLSLESSPSTQS